MRALQKKALKATFPGTSSFALGNNGKPSRPSDRQLDSSTDENLGSNPPNDDFSSDLDAVLGKFEHFSSVVCHLKAKLVTIIRDIVRNTSACMKSAPTSEED